MSNLAKYRRSALTAARHLGYPADILERVKKAKTEIEICRAMTTARHMQDAGWI